MCSSFVKFHEICMWGTSRFRDILCKIETWRVACSISLDANDVFLPQVQRYWLGSANSSGAKQARTWVTRGDEAQLWLYLKALCRLVCASYRKMAERWVTFVFDRRVGLRLRFDIFCSAVIVRKRTSESSVAESSGAKRMKSEAEIKVSIEYWARNL